MSRALMVVGTSVAMLALLLAALSISFDRWEGVAFYGVIAVLSGWLVAMLMRRERRARTAREALLPPERRPVRRVPRQPIRLPIFGAIVVFAVWYFLALLVSFLANGTLSWFDFAAIAPFASFMLTVFTFAGRHIAFRLTAEEADDRGR